MYTPKQSLILHIPHSSVNIPMMDGYCLDRAALNDEMLKLTDWYTDDLFHSENAIMIRAGFSRIFCDPERFTDDSQEVMAQYGMGVLYERRDDGTLMRTVTPELRNHILDEYYWKHHNNLAQAVNDQLEQFNKALIVDCHSYPSTPLVRDLSQVADRPDFNIGTDGFHTSSILIDLSIDFFAQAGYSLGVDWPYRGTLVPMEHYQKNSNVQSIMLEINRNLYLEEPTNNKSSRYHEVKKVTQDYLDMLCAHVHGM